MELVRALVQPAVDRLPDQRRRVGAVELIDCDDARGRGDVDLGEPSPADHVDADEDQPAFAGFGAKDGADFLLAGSKLRLRGLATDREIGSDFAFTGNAVDRARYFAVDEHD